MPIPQLSIKTKSPQNWRKTHKGAYYKIKKQEDFKNVKFKKTKQQRKKLKSLIKFLFIFGLLGGVIGTIIIVITFLLVSQNLPDPNGVIERNVTESTKIYDRTGEHILYDIHGEIQRTQVKLEELPSYIKWATIVREDKEFYSHPGFNLKGILRAAFVDITQGQSHGGSSITQQFIKNAILSSEKTLTRKVKELILAYQIEQKFTKDEILEMYLNEIPYGSTAYGIEAAAQTYFRKSSKDLTLAESAVLAALPKAPTYYSPYGSHRDELFMHQKLILDAMYEEKYVSQEELEQAKNEEIIFKPKKENILAPHFVFYIKELLTEKYGEKLIEQGGLKIYTTLDLYKQEIAEETVREGAENNLQYNASNAALVAIDPKNGQILAMVGSKDYFDETIDGNVNITTSARQPGSSFKPLVYAASFKKGYTPETILYDVETIFATAFTGDGSDYKPKNYNNKTYGPVTIRKSLAGSLNIPAVKTIYLTGIDNVLDLAEDMGYTTLNDRSRFGLSLVLGGGEVKLLEHVAAFGVFAREGQKYPLTSILKIEGRDGRVIEEWKESSGKKVLDTEVSRQINDILSDDEARSYVFGSGSYLTLGSRPVAAKTGTTNNSRDGWTVGYTPSLVAGVWVGNNDNSTMNSVASGSRVATPIWHNFMKRVLGDTPIEYFKEPEGWENNKDGEGNEKNISPECPLRPVLCGKQVGEVTLKIDRASGKLATELTPENYIEEHTYKQNHNILYYLNKEDPRGAPPEDPTRDPEFKTWEEGVIKWAESQGYINENSPTEYDDLHIKENIPQIEIIYPSNNQTFTSRSLHVEIKTSAPRGVHRVEYYIDDTFIKAITFSPFTLETTIKNSIAKGFHTLKAISFDDVDNSQSTTIDFNLTANPESVTMDWVSPEDNSSWTSSDFPLTLNLSLVDIEGVQKIDFYYSPTTGGPPHLMGSIIKPEGSSIDFLWQNPPQAGSYQLYAKTTDTNGAVSISEEVVINIK